MQPINLKLGDKLEIYADSGYFSANPCTSRIGEIIDNKHLLVYVPISGDGLVRLPLDRKYSFLFSAEEGLFGADGSILEYCIQEKADLMKIKINDFFHVQRRQYFRLRFFLKFIFMRKTEILQSEDKVPVYNGIIKDISGGGLRFITNSPLTLEEKIICVLCLEQKELTVEGAVLAKETLEDPDYKYNYRIEFVNIDNTLREQIVHCLFHIQRERIKKMRQKSRDEY